MNPPAMTNADIGRTSRFAARADKDTWPKTPANKGAVPSQAQAHALKALKKIRHLFFKKTGSFILSPIFPKRSVKG